MSINFQTFGEGTPLIVIHGLFGTSDNLKMVARQLSDIRKVYLIDAPAHGDSSSLDHITIENMAKRVVEFMKQERLDHVDILGHSLGGKIAMEIAMIQPILVSKLLVADIAPVQYSRRHDGIISGLKAIPLDTLSSRQDADATLATYIDDLGVRGFLLKSLVRQDPKELGWKWRFDLDQLATDYDEIIKANTDHVFNGPTLFIIGGDSDYVRAEYQPQIKNRFPNVKAKIISGAGHWLHAQRQTAFVKICRDFLVQ